MISTTAVENLMDVGRQRGGLDIDDIRRALPVDALSIEELADVLARLEEAGISVEIDPALLTGRHRKMLPHEVRPATPPSGHTERATTGHDRLSILASSIKAARENSSRTPGAALPHVHTPATYETAIKADGFLVMAHGTATEMARARGILGSAHPSSIEHHYATALSAADHREVSAADYREARVAN